MSIRDLEKRSYDLGFEIGYHEGYVKGRQEATAGMTAEQVAREQVAREQAARAAELGY